MKLLPGHPPHRIPQTHTQCWTLLQSAPCVLLSHSSIGGAKSIFCVLRPPLAQLAHLVGPIMTDSLHLIRLHLA